MASVAVAAIGSLVLANVDTMRWFGIGDDADAAAPATRVLSAEGETVAEQVVVQLVKESTPEGWKAGKLNASVNDPYSLTCLSERAAWSTARTRAITAEGGEGSVTALAYPAGAGAAAYAEVKAAVAVCAEGAEETGRGVEGMRYRKGAAAVEVVRRGDVVAVVSASPADRMPGEKWLTDLDDRAAALLVDRCLDPTAPAADVHRNPWVDPETFRGNLTTVAVPFPDVEMTTAEEITKDPVVPLDQVAEELAPAPVRPEPLTPAATDLPDLPLEVERPVAPTPPAEPDLDGRAERAVADPSGPGCGWAFTGEAVPAFDTGEAEELHRKAVKKERERLVDDAVAFEQAKVNHYRAWVEYERAASAYRGYVDEMTLVLAQWQVVIDARAEFVAEFELYRTSKQAYDDFVAEQQEARTAYEAAVEACRVQVPSPDGEPSADCPAEVPEILLQSAPEVLPRPVPSALAQLPEGWEPPAPVVPEPQPEPEPEPEPETEEPREDREDRRDRNSDRNGDRNGPGNGTRGDSEGRGRAQN